MLIVSLKTTKIYDLKELNWNEIEKKKNIKRTVTLFETWYYLTNIYAKKKKTSELFLSLRVKKLDFISGYEINQIIKT